MGSNVTKWLPTVITFIITILTVLGTQVQSFVGAHPTLSAILVGLIAVLNHLLPSPVASVAKAEAYDPKNDPKP